MEEIQPEKPLCGFVFACNDKTEDECLARAFHFVTFDVSLNILRVLKTDYC